MGDSIYQYIYWAADQASTLWAIVWPILTSDTAMRVYVLSVASVILVYSIWEAEKLSAEVRGTAAAAFTYKRRGRKPETPEAIARARDKLLAYRKDMWRDYFKLTAVFAACGFLIPSIGLYAGATFYDWFDPNTSPLIAKDGTETTADHIQLMCFVLDQLSRGALQDFFEVFNVNPIKFSNNPNNYVFSTFIFFYRFVVGTFSTALMFITWQAIVIAWSMPPVNEVVPSRQPHGA